MAKVEFLTPPSTPETLTCRTLVMPSSKEWLGVFNSALYNMLETWRWAQVNETDLTVDQAVAKVQEILDIFMAQGECEVCTQPDGQPFIRINPDGVIQQLLPDGWGMPEGDYELPPVPPREGGTDDDKKCLAAANAAHVWALLYENIADSQAANLTLSEAIVSFLLLVASLILAPLSLIIAAILAIAAIAFQVIFETAEFVTADYWTESFNELLICSLYECAQIDGEGVVTFDFHCFNEELAAKVGETLDPYTVLLWGQLQAMLMYIGGDGLNQMGATTQIETADCTPCNDHCFTINFLETNGAADGYTISGGTWVNGSGVEGVFINTNNRSDTWGYWTFPEELNVLMVEMTYTKTAGSGTANVNFLRGLNPVVNHGSVQVSVNSSNGLGTSLVKTLGALNPMAGVGVDINSGGTTTTVKLERLTVYYNGAIPAGWTDNCEE